MRWLWIISGLICFYPLLLIFQRPLTYFQFTSHRQPGRENRPRIRLETVNRKKNVFVVGLDEFNLELLRRHRRAETLAFHPLLSQRAVTTAERFDIELLLAEARRQLDAFDGTIDAIVGYWDFPTGLILPILRREHGLTGATLEAVLKCEHKYWSRLEQHAAMPEVVPRFALVDPFDDAVLDAPPLPYPFWIKPVKAHSSQLGFRVDDEEALREAIAEIRAHIWRLGKPFDELLRYADLPAAIAEVGGHHCIAEEIISAGRQCTLEGFVFRGEVTCYGVVDSVRDRRHRSCFSRYQYPSTLPRRVRERMGEAAGRVLQQIGYDNAPFNVEFFYDRRRDQIWLLEVNTRISKSHAPLFELVDGASNQEVMVDVALGRRPELSHRHGPYRCAAKFMLREFEAGRVSRVPDAATIRRIEQDFPGTRIELAVKPGMALEELMNQDSYSYEIGVIFTGAQSQTALLESYHRILDRLNLLVNDAEAA